MPGLAAAAAEPLSLTFRPSREQGTNRLAGCLARAARKGDVIALVGDLGAGKTAFARAFVRALCDPVEEVPSPTFTLVQIYEAPDFPIWHFDLYRIDDADEAIELGVEEAFATAVSLIEWPERLGRLLPADRLEVRIAAPPDAGEEAREIVLLAGPAWGGRLAGVDRCFRAADGG